MNQVSLTEDEKELISEIILIAKEYNITYKEATALAIRILREHINE